MRASPIVDARKITLTNTESCCRSNFFFCKLLLRKTQVPQPLFSRQLSIHALNYFPHPSASLSDLRKRKDRMLLMKPMPPGVFSDICLIPPLSSAQTQWAIALSLSLRYTDFLTFIILSMFSFFGGGGSRLLFPYI